MGLVSGIQEEDPRTYYVVGFLYSHDGKNVALIRKNRPEWQAGFLSGIGGKIEKGEIPTEAMEREFREETAYTVNYYEWKHFACLVSKHAWVECFSARGDLIQLQSITDEQIEIHGVDSISTLKTVPNVQWLVRMGLSNDVIFSHTICTS